MFVWCLITVMTTCGLGPNVLCEGTTAVRGKVKTTNDTFYLVDFSEYAKKQDYVGLNTPKMVEKYKCMEDK